MDTKRAKAGYSRSCDCDGGIAPPARHGRVFRCWFGYGLFFLVAALAQLLYPVVLLRRPSSRAVLIAGIVGNALIVGLWIVTRTWGVPLGPAAGEVEAMGIVDMSSKLAELALIGCLLFLLRNSAQER